MCVNRVGLAKFSHIIQLYHSNELLTSLLRRVHMHPLCTLCPLHFHPWHRSCNFLLHIVYPRILKSKSQGRHEDDMCQLRNTEVVCVQCAQFWLFFFLTHSSDTGFVAKWLWVILIIEHILSNKSPACIVWNKDFTSFIIYTSGYYYYFFNTITLLSYHAMLYIFQQVATTL